MPSIESIISKYCPNGVDFKSLDELGVFFSGLSGKTKKDFYRLLQLIKNIS